MRVCVRVCVAVLLAAALGLAGCEPGQEVRPPEPRAKAAGELSGGRYLNRALGLFWSQPAGYRPWRPGAGQDFLFGWRSVDGKIEVRLWVLAAGGPLREAAQGLARAQGWKLGPLRAISWLSRRAVDAGFTAGARAGRLRVVAAPAGALAVAALTPAGDLAVRKAAMVAVMEGLRLIPPGDVLHTVKRRAETLAMVALWYTGSARRWRQLKAYNHLKSTRLSPGQEILIPAELVWRAEPMPPWVLGLSRPPAARGRKVPRGRPEESAPDLELLPTGPK